jgi:hypothetical protein
MEILKDFPTFYSVISNTQPGSTRSVDVTSQNILDFGLLN